ncbi:SelB C-terminal domain-containing protein [Desulfonema limicola]|nr:SelB C-terminal domain-containing protein [Desulfonema limicola]
METFLRQPAIEPGIAQLELPSGRQTALVDVPGHTDFLKNTIRGLSAVDLAVLVAAADDGVMPQTREHLKILEFMNAKGGIVVVSKSDLVDNETLELAGLEIEELVKGSFLENKPILPFSAVDKSGKSNILKAIDQESTNISGKHSDTFFRLWIDQVRHFQGIGTVASGTVLSGILNKNDLLDLLPSGIKTRARSLEIHGKKTDTARAGQRVGINLHGVSLDQVRRGMLLSCPGRVECAYMLNSEFCLSDYAEPVKNRQKIKLFIGTSLITASVILMEKQELLPGEKGLVQFRTSSPAACIPGENYVAALMNSQTIIGGGRILETAKSKFRHSRAEKILPRLQAVLNKDIKAVINSAEHDKSLSPEKLSRQTGLPFKDFESGIQSMISRGELLKIDGYGIFRKNTYENIKTMIKEIIPAALKAEPLKTSMSFAEIKDKLAVQAETDLVSHIIAELLETGFLIRENGGYRIPDMACDLSAKHLKISKKLLDFAKTSGIVPFTAHTAWKECKEDCSKNEVEKLLYYLSRNQKLACLNNQRFVSLYGVEKIKDLIQAAILEKGSISLKDSKDLLGYGRYGAVPVFEYLDEIGFTFRQGDERVLKKSYADKFHAS